MIPASNQLQGGPLDGVEIQGLPGPLAGAVLLYFEPTQNAMASALAGIGLDPASGAAANRQTFSMMFETLIRGCEKFGIDPHALVSEITSRAERTTEARYMHQALREPGGAD